MICIRVDPDGGNVYSRVLVLVIDILWSAGYIPRSKEMDVLYSQSTGTAYILCPGKSLPCPYVLYLSPYPQGHSACIHSYSSILYSSIHLAQPISVPIPPRGHHSRPISAQNAACGPIICQASPLPNGEAFMMAAAAARGEECESNPDSCSPPGLWRTQAPCMHRHNALPALVPGKQSSDTSNGLDRFPEHRR